MTTLVLEGLYCISHVSTLCHSQSRTQGGALWGYSSSWGTYIHGRVSGTVWSGRAMNVCCIWLWAREHWHPMCTPLYNLHSNSEAGTSYRIALLRQPSLTKVSTSPEYYVVVIGGFSTGTVVTHTWKLSLCKNRNSRPKMWAPRCCLRVTAVHAVCVPHHSFFIYLIKWQEVLCLLFLKEEDSGT